LSDLKRTPLFEVYKDHGAKLVDFGGWELPVLFAGIKEEHLAVRERAGIFDVSHMGEIFVKGPGALSLVQRAACNDAARLAAGRSQYSALLDDKGGIIDDVFVYRTGGDEYLLCVNAANTDRDFEWLKSIGPEGCEVDNRSGSLAQIAVQGPRAAEVVASAAGHDVTVIKRLEIAPVEIAGAKVLAARTGYTGEDGFELFAPADSAVEVWKALMAVEECGPVPCGLGARDTLRLEMGYPLHGHDITQDTTPIEADLEWIVSMYKREFIGREALERQKKAGTVKKRVGLVMEEAGVPREGYRIVTRSGEGKVTSGTKTPSLQKSVAMGYLPAEDAEPGETVEIEIRGKMKKARIEKWPFYRRDRKTEMLCGPPE